jgi:hypothetical protein
MGNAGSGRTCLEGQPASAGRPFSCCGGGGTAQLERFTWTTVPTAPEGAADAAVVGELSA